MLQNFSNITVYHGSYTEVKNPDLNKCKSAKDFGKGFYVTTDKNQAIKFAKLVAVRSNVSLGIVNEYLIEDLNGLSFFEFSDTDLKPLEH